MDRRVWIPLVMVIVACIVIGLLVFKVSVMAEESIHPKVLGGPAGTYTTYGWTQPDPGYDQAYEYSYGDAYVKVETTYLYVVGDKIVGGLIQKFNVVGNGDVKTYILYDWPKVDQNGCSNGVELPMNKGIIIYGLHDVDLNQIYGSNVRYTVEDLGGVKYYKVFGVGVVYLIYNTHKDYAILGFSRTTNYWCWAVIGYGLDYTKQTYEVSSAIFPISISVNPSKPVAGDYNFITVVLNMQNNCKYRGSMKFKLELFDSNGNRIYENEREIWVDGNSVETVKWPITISLDRPGEYTIKLTALTGDTWTKKFYVYPPQPSPIPIQTPIQTPKVSVEITSIAGYIGLATGLSLLAYAFARSKIRIGK